MEALDLGQLQALLLLEVIRPPSAINDTARVKWASDVVDVAFQVPSITLASAR